MSGTRRYRALSEEEIELWRHVAMTIEQRPGSTLPSRPEPPLKPAQTALESAPAKMVRHGVTAPYRPPQSQPRGLVPPLAPIETKFRRKVTRGQAAIERVIDLHGLNQEQAHGALRTFLRGAQADGLRLLLVVTGKGQRARLSSDARGEPGVLRRAVPHWLREPDLRAVVLGFEEAGQPHGGAGALYIRLRQKRS